METHKDLPVVRFESLRDWIMWLEKNHDSTPKGVWMKIAKKNSGQWGLNYEQTREGALRYGWIDSLPNKYDEKFYLLKVTPRRPKSVWSKINVALIETYIIERKMHPAGMKEVKAAQADGRWDQAY